MEKNEESGSPGWSASFFSQTTEDVARAVAAAAAAVRSPRPSVVYSSKDESGSPLKRLQLHVSRMMKGLSSPPDVQSGSYNPEILTSQKRQWANFQLQSLDHRVWKETSKLFESMVVVGLPPSSDIQALQNLYFARKFEGSGRLRSALGGQHQCRVEPNIEPQVLLVYPPEKQLPLKYKDLLSFCFPAGVEVNAVERTPSMSEFNEILLGQEHLKQSDLSFVFRLQVADASTLYGCCVLVEEFIQKPSGLISKMSDGQPLCWGLSRHVLTTRRCYCILSRLPFFELHFGVLNSIFNEERLEQLTKQISTMNMESPFGYGMIEMLEEKNSTLPLENGAVSMQDERVEASQSSATFLGRVTDDNSHSEHQGERVEASQSSDTFAGRVTDDKSHSEHQDGRIEDSQSSDTFAGRVTDDKSHSEHLDGRVEASQSSTSGTFSGRVSDDMSHTVHQNERVEASQSSTSCTFLGSVSDDMSLTVHQNERVEASQSSTSCTSSERVTDDTSHSEHQNLNGDLYSHEEPNLNVVRPDPETEKLAFSREPAVATYMNDNFINRESGETRLLHAVSPILQNQQCGSSESSPSFSGSLREDRHFRSGVHEAETEEASSSGRDIFCEQSDILEWVKANNHGSLQIIHEYYKLDCPTRGSTIKFQPLDHLHPLEYYRHDETVLHFAGSAIDLRSCTTSLGLAEAQSALMVEEEAAALSVWSVACLCGSLRLEHVLTFFAGALLEKQIVVVCSNLGVLSALVLSIIPLIRPYQWQSLLMPVLPNDMLDFLDAPVPYIVGVKNKTTEVQSKLTNVILVDANRNQVKSPTIPQLPQYRELYSCLRPYHEKLVGESFLGKKRPVYECTDVQAEAAKGFLGVLRSYLDSLCFNLRSHTITNVQSNDDKVSLLLKESFIESFHGRNRPFMKLFLDTQLFSVHTDFVLSFFQKE